MDVEDRKKHVKHHLIDLGMSFREWCRRNELPYSVARDIVYGRLDGSKSENSLRIKRFIQQEFGKNIFD